MGRGAAPGWRAFPGGGGRRGSPPPPGLSFSDLLPDGVGVAGGDAAGVKRPVEGGLPGASVHGAEGAHARPGKGAGWRGDGDGIGRGLLDAPAPHLSSCPGSARPRGSPGNPCGRAHQVEPGVGAGTSNGWSVRAGARHSSGIAARSLECVDGCAVAGHGIGLLSLCRDRGPGMFRRHFHDRCGRPGTGPSAAKRTVGRHGGIFRVASPPGGGPTLPVTLPAAPAGPCRQSSGS